MTLSFRYKSVKRPDGTNVRTPSIPITLSGKESFDTMALLDSGADISAISEELADFLGLSRRGAVMEAYGIGGSVKSVETTVRVVTSKGHERYLFDVPVKIIMGQYDFPVLLGRRGFFDKFKICFDEENEKVALNRNSAK